LDDLNEEAFVAKIRQGDALAFQILFDRLMPKLCHFIIALFGVRQHDAEEIASDSMLKVHKSVARFNPRGGAKLTTWIFEIVRNTAVDHLRKQASQKNKAVEVVTLDDHQQGAGDKVNPNSKNEGAYELLYKEQEEESEDQPSLSPQLRRMSHAFGSLSEQDRDILRMRQVMDYDEIARVEKISVNAARVRHARAEERLRNAFEKGEENER